MSDYQQQIEFYRYKQDCRKRALDLATNQWLATGSIIITENGVAKSYSIQEAADKYYNWLISIPEK